MKQYLALIPDASMGDVVWEGNFCTKSLSYQDVSNIPKLYDWMFSHKIGVPEPSVAILAISGFFIVLLRRRTRL
jgi:hypothetical protein